MNLFLLTLVCIFTSSVRGMEIQQKNSPAHKSLENLLTGFSETEKKEITEEYTLLKATLNTAAILTKTTVSPEKKKELQQFCISKHSNRNSSGDEKNIQN